MSYGQHLDKYSQEKGPEFIDLISNLKDPESINNIVKKFAGNYRIKLLFKSGDLSIHTRKNAEDKTDTEFKSRTRISVLDKAVDDLSRALAQYIESNKTIDPTADSITILMYGKNDTIWIEVKGNKKYNFRASRGYIGVKPEEFRESVSSALADLRASI